jgi:hypothetical protein
MKRSPVVQKPRFRILPVRLQKSTLLGRIDQSVATALGRLSRFDPGTSKIQVLRRDSWKKQSEEVFGLLT